MHHQATYNREPFERTRKALRIAGEAVCLLIACGAFYSALVLAAILETPPPEPETRCFETAWDEMDYCRTQRHWEIK
jgi:hypothetical protein